MGLEGLGVNARPFTMWALLGLAAVALWAWGGSPYLNLDSLRAHQAQLAAWYAQAPATVMALYFAVYVLATALSFPGATVITLAGGAVFGLGWGLLLVSFASSLGALLAFGVARYLLRDMVQARLGARLDAFHQGLERDGAYYLLSLRLVPLVPFFVINLAMGLTRMPGWTFYWVSQLGMLPGTAVYVNAGTQLAHIQSASDVFSPGLLGAFVLLGLLPLLARWGLAALQQRSVLAPWRAQRPHSFDRNLVVIGAGAGGLVSAYLGAAAQARVTLVEARQMGGDCLHSGCVPSKALIHCARLAHQLRHAEHYAFDSCLRTADGRKAAISFKKVMQHVQAAMAAVAPHDSVQRYTALGVEVLQGHARITTPWTVEVTHADGSVQALRTRSIVIAAGARPVVPALPGLEHVAYVTSDTLWERLAALDTAPAHLLVLGGGPVGCELAQAFARLGSQVTLVEQGSRLLSGEDADVSAVARHALQADGVTVYTNSRALRVQSHAHTRGGTADGTAAGVLVVSHHGTEHAIAFDQLLLAVGRAPHLNGYGLEALGLATQQHLPTNAYLQTRYPHIYAVGDVTGPLQFTHAAAHQAWYATVNALLGGLHRLPVDYRCVPHATFIDPEVARVGLNVQEATAQGIAHEVTRFALAGLDRVLCESAPGHTSPGFVKVLTVPGKDTILGATIVGPQAAELLAEYVLAMRHGLGLNKILATVHTYPTLSEANRHAAGAWRRAHPPQALLAWARRFHDWQRR